MSGTSKILALFPVRSSNLLPTRIMSTVTNTRYKDFDDIPGPTALPLIGTRHLYLPFVGKYSFQDLSYNGFAKLKKYGSIVREDIKPGVTLVWIFTPEDYATLYQNEGAAPYRQSHLAMQKYRLDRPELYKNGGLLPSNGEEWLEIRRSFQKYFKIQAIKSYIKSSNDIIDEFFEQRIERIRDFHDFQPELSRLFLELTFYATFNERLQTFDDAEWNAESESSLLVKAIGDINRNTLATDFGPHLWKWFNTPAYKKIALANEIIEKMAVKMMAKMIKNFEKEIMQKRACSFLKQFLTDVQVDIKATVGMVVDLLLGGVDTMAFSTSFALYRISTNREIQQKLFDEARALMPERKDEVSDSVMQQSAYMKAVQKEAHRIDPLSVGIGRILTKPCVFSGYRVPEGTIVVTQNQVTCRLPQYFSQPDSFIPERWLKGSAEYESVNPFLSLPFSHGPRSCIARRLATQFLRIAMMKIVRNYELTWNGGVLGKTFELVNKPDAPLSITFKPRRR